MDLPIKCGDTAGNILLNAAIEAEQTFKYIGPELKKKRLLYKNKTKKQNTYSEITGPSLTCSIKRAMISDSNPVNVSFSFLLLSRIKAITMNKYQKRNIKVTALTDLKRLKVNI